MPADETGGAQGAAQPDVDASNSAGVGGPSSAKSATSAGLMPAPALPTKPAAGSMPPPAPAPGRSMGPPAAIGSTGGSMGPPGLPGPKTSVPPVPLAAKEPSPQSAPVRPHPVMCCTLLPVTIPNSPGSASCPGLPSTVLVTLSRCWSARPLQAPAAAYEKPEWSSAPDAEKHAPSFAPPLLPAARLPAGPFHLVAIQDCSPSPVPLRTPPPCRRPRRAARRCRASPHGIRMG